MAEVIARARYDQASQVLQATAGAAGAAPQLDSSPLWLLAPDSASDLDTLVPTLMGGLAAWIVSNIRPVDEAITQVTGDPDAIAAVVADWQQVGPGLDAHNQMMTSMRIAVNQTWQGQGVVAFNAHSAAEQGCTAAAVGPMNLMAERLLAVGGYAGNARKTIIGIAGNLIGELVEGAVAALKWWWFPLKWPSALSDFIAWGHDLIASTLERIANVLQDVVAQGTELLGQLALVGNDFSRAAGILTTGTDPGRQGDLGPDGTPGRDIQGERQEQRDAELAMLASIDVEDGTIKPLPDGYTRLSDEAVAALGIDPALLVNDETGFMAGLVRAPDGSLVVAMAGTHFPDLTGDAAEDATGAVVLSGQSADAVRLAEALAGTADRENVIYTGHSLGGRLAAVASMATGNGAVTYNAAGVSPATIDYFARRNGMDPTEFRHQLQNGQVRLYTTADDPLTNLQENYGMTSGIAPDAVGLQYRLDGDHPIWDLTGGHGMGNVRDRLDTAGRGDNRLNPE